MKELFFLLLAFSVGLLIIKYFENKRTDEIFEDAGFSIGKIISYRHFRSGKFSSQPSKLEYTYTYKGNNYKDTYTDHIPSGITIGNNYFVIVNKKDPTKTIIFFDCLVNDSTDFKRYLHKFKNAKRTGQ